MPQTFLLPFICSVLLTYFLRALPFMFFSSRPMPGWMQKLGQSLPAAIMALLIVYCLKDIPDHWVLNGIPDVLGILATALLYLKKDSVWIAILFGTAVYLGSRAMLSGLL